MVPATETKKAPVNIIKIGTGRKADSPKLNDSQMKPIHITRQNRTVKRSKFLRFRLNGGVTRLNIKEGNAKIMVRANSTINM